MALARINLQALVQNYQNLKSIAPLSKTLGVIKADAYGHGLIEVAKVLEDSDGLAVARLEEALQLREAGIRNSILLLDGVLTLRELRAAISHKFKLVLHNQSELDLLQQIGIENELPLTVWLKVNTGMNRLGFSLDQLPDVCETLSKLSWVNVECLMTHFANADSGKLKDIKKALGEFKKAQALCPDITESSLCNSAALFASEETHADWNRPGIAMYGCSTLEENPIELLPVMHFSAPVIAVNSVKKGETVGYGSTWKAKHDTCIAVIGVGYGDGYPRHAQNGTPVEIGGEHYPLAGRVSMDMITVDIGDNEQNISVGDEAVLWGSETLSADLVAEWADTISYELFCQVTNRVKREYLNG